MKIKNKYFYIFKTTFSETFAYKIDFLMNFLSSFALVIVQYFIWKAVYFHKEKIVGFSFTDTITYMVMVWSVYGFCNTMDFTREFQEEVLNGSISYKILFPVNLYIYFFIKTYSKNLMRLFFSGFSIIFLSYILFPLKIPAFTNLFIFILVLNLSFIINFNISYIIALSSSYFNKIEGLIQLNSFLSAIFSGALMPLNFFPSFIRNLSNILPYKGIIYIPLSIFIGKLSGWESLFMILFQCAWILVLKIVIISLSNAFYKKIEVFGG